MLVMLGRAGQGDFGAAKRPVICREQGEMQRHAACSCGSSRLAVVAAVVECGSKLPKIAFVSAADLDDLWVLRATLLRWACCQTSCVCRARCSIKAAMRVS